MISRSNSIYIKVLKKFGLMRRSIFHTCHERNIISTQLHKFSYANTRMGALSYKYKMNCKYSPRTIGPYSFSQNNCKLCGNVSDKFHEKYKFFFVLHHNNPPLTPYDYEFPHEIV